MVEIRNIFITRTWNVQCSLHVHQEMLINYYIPCLTKHSLKSSCDSIFHTLPVLRKMYCFYIRPNVTAMELHYWIFKHLNKHIYTIG